MYKRIQFESGYAYTADGKKDYIGRISAGNAQFVDIIQSNGNTIRAFYGIMYSDGNFYIPCMSTACLKICPGIPPIGFFCLQNPVSISKAGFYVKID